MKTIQWNIGGGKVRSHDSGQYDTDGLEDIAAFILWRHRKGDRVRYS